MLYSMIFLSLRPMDKLEAIEQGGGRGPRAQAQKLNSFISNLSSTTYEIHDLR